MQFPWAGSSHMKPGQVSQQEVITLLHLNWLTIRKTYGVAQRDEALGGVPVLQQGPNCTSSASEAPGPWPEWLSMRTMLNNGSQRSQYPGTPRRRGKGRNWVE